MIKNLLIALLLCTTAGASFLAYRQTQGRAALERRLGTAAGPEVAVPSPVAGAPGQDELQREAELTELRERTRAQEETIRDLRGEISLLQAGRSRGPSLTGRAPHVPIPRRLLSELLRKPETVGLALDWIKADQNSRYAALIARQTQLTPAQREELRTLLAERYATRMDWSAADAAVGLPADERRGLDAEFRQKLVALVGRRRRSCSSGSRPSRSPPIGSNGSMTGCVTRPRRWIGSSTRRSGPCSPRASSISSRRRTRRRWRHSCSGGRRPTPGC